MKQSEPRLRDLYRQSRDAALLGLMAGLGLGAVKLAGGIWGHSIALVSDSVHSLGDALVCLVVFGALRWSQRPPDREHPYGHTRVEAVVGSNLALLLIFSGLGIIWEALHTLRDLSPEPEGFTLGIALGSVILKEGLYRYNRRIARSTGSSSIRAAAWDHRVDALSSTAVLAGLGLAKWGGPDYHAADHIAALIVALAILWAGGHLFWTSLQELLDRQADPELVEAVRGEAQAVQGVSRIEKLRVRKSGLEYLVDIHVEVDPKISVREGHDIAHGVKDKILERIVPVKDVLVHIEPSSRDERAAGSGASSLRGG